MVATWQVQLSAQPLLLGENLPVSLKLTLLTWNLLLHRLKKPHAFGLAQRTPALAATLHGLRADLWCFQEAGPQSLGLLRSALEGYEFCVTNSAMPENPKPQGELLVTCFDARRFRLSGHGHFWLSETPEKPSASFGWPYPQLTTWVRLSENTTGQGFVLMNTHFGHGAACRQKSAALLINRLGVLTDAGPSLLVGDFNTPPGDTAFAPLLAHGLARAETGLGQKSPRTLHVHGFGVSVVDGLWHSPHFSARSFRLVKGRRGVVHASDHFGLMSELAMNGE